MTILRLLLLLAVSTLGAAAQVCTNSQVTCIVQGCKEEKLSSWGNSALIRVDYTKLFLQADDVRRTLLFQDNKRCLVSAAFLNESHIYVESCSGSFVVDNDGKRLYKMPSFKFWDIAPDKSGSRFAVLERARSTWHEFGQESYDKLRLIVYQTATGQKLFEYKWSASADEHPVQESVGLSPDGSVVYLCQRGVPARQFSVP